MVVPLIVFFALQRYFVQGLLAGSVKILERLPGPPHALGPGVVPAVPVFRMSLVDVVDEVLDRLEADERLRFTLDGQLATVDDYLEIRPEDEQRIRALVEAGGSRSGPGRC